MAWKYSGRYTPPALPKNADEGSEAIRKATLKLFSRTDGEAADWSLMAESLLKVAFDCLDRVQDDGRRMTLLRRIEAGTYDRLARNDPDPWQNTPTGPGALGRSMQPAPDGPDLSDGPRPPSRRQGR